MESFTQKNHTITIPHWLKAGFLLKIFRSCALHIFFIIFAHVKPITCEIKYLDFFEDGVANFWKGWIAKKIRIVKINLCGK